MSILSTGFSSSSREYGFVINEKYITGKSIETLRDYKNATHFQFNNCAFPMRRSGVERLYQTMMKVKDLHTLTFLDCQFSPSQFVLVRRLCMDLKELFHLTLSNCYLVETDFEDLFYSLGHSRISTLDISGNYVTDDVLRRFRRCLANLNNLTFLNNTEPSTRKIQAIENKTLDELSRVNPVVDFRVSQVAVKLSENITGSTGISAVKEKISVGNLKPYDRHMLARMERAATLQEQLAIYQEAVKNAGNLYCLDALLEKVIKNTFDVWKSNDGIDDVFSVAYCFFQKESKTSIKEDVIDFLRRDPLNLQHCRELEQGAKGDERDLLALLSVLEEDDSSVRIMLFDPYISLSCVNGKLESPLVLGKSGPLIHVTRNSEGKYFALTFKRESDDDSSSSTALSHKEGTEHEVSRIL